MDRAGLRDVEIAVRLGITTGEARARVAPLRRAMPIPAEVGRRGPTEDEAVAGEALAAAPTVTNRVALVLGTVGTLLFVAVAAFALAIIGASEGAKLDDGRPPSAPTMSSLADDSLSQRTPSPTLVIPVIDGVPFEVLQLHGSGLLPDDVAVILESNCEHCPWDTGLYRLRTVAGQPMLETLFLTPDAEPMTVHAANDGSVLVVSLTKGRTISFQRSDDGGVTWRRSGEVVGEIAFLEAVGPNHLRVRVVERGVESIVALPEQVSAREAVLDTMLVPWPIYSAIEKTGPPPFGPYRYTSWAAIPGGGAVATIIPPFPSATNTALAVFGPQGALLRGFAETPFGVVGMVTPNLVAASVELGARREIVGPALINISTGGVNPLRGPVSSSLASLRIRAVLTGPFLLVRDFSEDCASIVDAWNGDTLVEVACAASGVLLRDTRIMASPSSGEEWMSVETPAGVKGWIRKSQVDVLSAR